MERTVNFSYKSIGNFVKLLSTIRYEKEGDPRGIAIWEERFEGEEGDNLFEGFLRELFPNGKTIEVEDIDLVVNRALRFLEKDMGAKRIRNRYKKMDNTYWVYFKPDEEVYPCGYAKHEETVRNICCDFFKGFEDLDPGYLKRFILENFTIKSDNSTIERIAADAQYIAAFVILRGKHEI